MKNSVSKNNYKKFIKSMVFSDFLGIMVWMSLTTFSLNSRNLVGVNNIPVLELIMALTAIIGVKIAHSKFTNMKIAQVLTILVQTIFLAVLMFVLVVKSDLLLAGYAMYSIIIVNTITKRITTESFRRYEQVTFNTEISSKFLTGIRNRTATFSLIGAAIGSIIAVIFITFMKISLIDFTICMIIFNILQNGYDYALWFKYLK